MNIVEDEFTCGYTHTMVFPQLPYPENVIPTLRFQFCPMCAARLTREIIFDDNIPRVKCPACGWIPLSSNAVGIAVIARNDQGIVAILPPGEDGVGLPAGMVEYGEDPAVSAIREVREETGLNVRIVDCLGWAFIDRTVWPGPIVQIFYEAEITGGDLKGSDEGEAKIFPLDDFPAISTRRIGSQKAIQLYQARVKNRYT